MGIKVQTAGVKAIAEVESTKLKDSANVLINPAKEDGNLAGINTKIAQEQPRKTTLGANFTHGAVSVGTSATLIKSANTARRSLLIQNLGTGAIYVGGSTVSTANGIKLDAGENITIDRTTAAIYGISTATQDVRFLEEID